MIDAKKFLELGSQLHGHRCPALALGLRAGAEAMNALAVPRAKDRELLALVELGDEHCSTCFGDGVQTVTGCTFGKGNVRRLGYGKFAVTLVERATGRAVRVASLAEAQARMRRSPLFLEYRAKGIPTSQVPEAVLGPVVDQVMGAPAASLLAIGPEHRRPVDPPRETMEIGVCEACGETVVEAYLRVAGGRRVCIPCQERLGAR